MHPLTYAPLFFLVFILADMFFILSLPTVCYYVWETFKRDLKNKFPKKKTLFSNPDKKLSENNNRNILS